MGAGDIMRKAIAEGFAEYLDDVDGANAKAAAGADRTHHEAEQRRVAAILTSDRIAKAREQRRQEAMGEVEDGALDAVEDTWLGPTAEQLEQGEYRRVATGKVEGSARPILAMRRVMSDRLVQLHSRGVLDDDTFAACAWYRQQWERTGLAVGPQISRLEPTVRGAPQTDHLPRTEEAWEAWQLYRFARDGIPEDVRALFDGVVLDGSSIDAAARAAGCRYRNASAAFRRGALELHDTIRHLLPVRQL